MGRDPYADAVAAFEAIEPSCRVVHGYRRAYRMAGSGPAVHGRQALLPQIGGLGGYARG